MKAKKKTFVHTAAHVGFNSVFNLSVLIIICVFGTIYTFLMNKGFVKSL